MLSKLLKVEPLISNTPLMELNHNDLNLYAKLELHNVTGSIKIRPAFYILKKAIQEGYVNSDSTIIESSSGNFALALATLCKYLNLKFIAVIDDNINDNTERLLNLLAFKVVKVTESDHTGGYLLNRLKKVQELRSTIINSFWTNQYGNENNFLSHYHGIGKEIADRFEELHYAFIGVGSGGTIAGTSRKLKEKFPDIKIIAVDSEGSVIFGTSPKKRHISGLGSSIKPDMLKYALIDEVIHVSEVNTTSGCKKLLEENFIFGGGSSGTVYFAINEYFREKNLKERPNVIFICPDGGWPYIPTVYNIDWISQLKKMEYSNSVVV
ncbi:2,3-diaminopropionate biosynthesis protein SbnA [Bacillus cereus]|uniref:2,3-diaminopropionate biosynthesis protein SbnA n=1 Tax=Bacillus cereus TaxID=1396 RepID=UPI003D05C862